MERLARGCELLDQCKSAFVLSDAFFVCESEIEVEQVDVDAILQGIGFSIGNI